jgi:hypothetical protein
MTGRNFELIGYPWALPTAPPALIGDLNCDGAVGFGNTNPFVALLTGGG